MPIRRKTKSSRSRTLRRGRGGAKSRKPCGKKKRVLKSVRRQEVMKGGTPTLKTLKITTSDMDTQLQELNKQLQARQQQEDVNSARNTHTKLYLQNTPTHNGAFAHTHTVVPQVFTHSKGDKYSIFKLVLSYNDHTTKSLLFTASANNPAKIRSLLQNKNELNELNEMHELNIMYNPKTAFETNVYSKLIKVNTFNRNGINEDVIEFDTTERDISTYDDSEKIRISINEWLTWLQMDPVEADKLLAQERDNLQKMRDDDDENYEYY